MNGLGDKTHFGQTPTQRQQKHHQESPFASNGSNGVQEQGHSTQEADWSSVPYPPPWHLQTARLDIRPYHMNDAARLAHIADDVEVARQMSDRFPHPYTLESARGFINDVSSPERLANASRQIRDAEAETAPEIRHFAIVLRVDENGDAHEGGGLLIGGIGVDAQPGVYRRGAEIGYWLARPYWSKGYATEATQEVVEWLFDGLDDGLTGREGESILRLTAGVFGGNEKSVRVLERVGFVIEARLRDAVWKSDEVRDLVLLGMTRRQWETKAAVRGVQAS